MFSSVFSPPWRTLFELFKINSGSQRKTTLIPALLFLLSHALSGANPGSLPGDSTLIANICADEFYVFNGDTLNQPGTYTATYIASDGSDSTVSLLLSVFPL